MGKPTGFLEFDRELPASRNPKDRIKDYHELYLPFDQEKTNKQAARCMDCGIPFCHSGCPLGNNIPEFNDAVYHGNFELAISILQATNNFPEFTGRICPAPCEASCVLGINKPPVAIEHIEKTIAETAFEQGFIKAIPPRHRTGKTVAIVGSGPAGLAAAAQLNKAGHTVTVFERDDEIGGLLRYGIPDFKLEKWVVERRVKIMEEEGVVFKTNTNIGVDISATELQNDYDAVLLAGGSTIPRDLNIPGRELKGIHYAMDFLTQQNRRVSGKKVLENEIKATDKKVLVIGGGDTGSDCVGTSNRHGATSVTQIEILEKPPLDRNTANPWPEWPMILRTSSSHEEGVERDWSLMTKAFIGNKKGEVTGIKVVSLNWYEDDGKKYFEEIEGSERVIEVDLVLLAAGFVHPQKEGMLDQLAVALDKRGNVATKGYRTASENVFAAGDMRRGQSLVVWAISEGREAARAIDSYLEGKTYLESKEESLLHL